MVCGILGMKQPHQLAAASYEDEHVTVPDTALHPLVYHAAQRTDSLAHVRPARAQIVAHRVVKAEHDRKGFSPTIPSAHTLYLYQSGREGRSETEASRPLGHPG